MKTVRYAVVGLGHIAQVAILPAFAHAENSELVALITGNPEKAEELSKRYGARAFAYEDFEKALKDERVDAVFIALPNTMHREYTERAAAAGVHVLCEKPMATTAEDCEAMIAACQQHGVKLMIAYRLHFADAHTQAVKLLRDRQIGELRYFSSLFAMQVKEDNIRVRDETGGGTLFDIGIYCINAARYLFQAEPTQVIGVTATRPDPRFDEVEEMTTAIMRFPGDRVASFTCSFGSKDMDLLDVVGTKGTLHMEPAYEYVGELQWKLKIGEESTDKTFPRGDQFAGEIIYFSDCVLKDRETEPSGQEGLTDLRIINAIYESARSGRPVKLHGLGDAERPDEGQEIKRPPVEKPKTVAVEAPHD